MMGNTIPLKCLMVLETWAAQWKSGPAEGTDLFCLSSY